MVFGRTLVDKTGDLSMMRRAREVLAVIFNLSTKDHVMSNALKALVALFFLAAGLINAAFGQRPADTTQPQLEAFRDAFAGRIKAMGYTPALPAPPIVMDNPRSFGNYDDSANVLHTGNWSTLPQDQKAIFENFARMSGHGMTAKEFFNQAVYKWIFVHELGHWWRKCQHQDTNPYAEEKAANRIAAAYWHEADPKFYTFMVSVFQGMVDHVPSPVPVGQEKEAYLNANYQNLPGGQSYSWYQSIMNVEVSHEQPFETFRQAIQNAGNPLPASR
jgi:hypothetical protein